MTKGSEMAGNNGKKESPNKRKGARGISIKRVGKKKATKSKK